MRLSPCVRCAATVLAAALLFLPLAAASARDAGMTRDWKQAPAIVEVDTPGDLYAVGDVHGDYERLITVLVKAKLIASDPGAPERVQWSGGKAVLVCTGDLIDKWDQSLRVLALFQALQASAAKSGGRVIVTMGNHEAEFLADPAGKKTSDFRKELTTAGLDPAAVAAGKDPKGVGAFLVNLPLAARVNDWFFCHAGDTQGRTLKQLRTALQDDITRDGFGAAVLLGKHGLLEARLHPEPWWEEPGEKAAVSEARLAKYVADLGVKHLVIGHQPGGVTFADGTKRKAGELIQKFDGLIYFIDVGMSRGVGNSAGAVLHVEPGEHPKVTVIPADGNPHGVP